MRTHLKNNEKSVATKFVNLKMRNEKSICAERQRLTMNKSIQILTKQLCISLTARYPHFCPVFLMCTHCYGSWYDSEECVNAAVP